MEMTLYPDTLNGRASYGSDNVEVEVAGPSSGLLATVGDRLNMLSNLLDVAEQNSANARSRIFGGWPQEATGSAEKAPQDVASMLMAQIDGLTAQARRLCENTSALSGGL